MLLMKTDTCIETTYFPCLCLLFHLVHGPLHLFKEEGGKQQCKSFPFTGTITLGIPNTLLGSYLGGLFIYSRY
jgi:hypothetical protein